MSFTMSLATDYATREQVETYVSKHKVRNVLQVLFSELVLHLPENPIMYMMESLKNKLVITPDMPLRPKRVTVMRNGSRRGGQVCFVTDSKETFLRKAGALLGFREPATRLFNVRGAEYMQIEIIDSEETLFVSAGEDFLDPTATAIADFCVQADLAPPKSATAEPEPTPSPAAEPSVPSLIPVGQLLGVALTTPTFRDTFVKLRQLSRSILLKYIDINDVATILTHVGRTHTPESWRTALEVMVQHNSADTGTSPPDLLLNTFAPQSFALFEHSGVADVAELGGAIGFLCRGITEEKQRYFFSLSEHDGVVSDRESLYRSFVAVERMLYAFGEVPTWSEDARKGVRDVLAAAFTSPNPDQKLDFDEYVSRIHASPVLTEFFAGLTNLTENLGADVDGDTDLDDSRSQSVAPEDS
eukprot:gnl/Spiro4/10288_TR5475_c0_g1_i1.p1 gnl/Spiro4/10288_TR5475_c0_g1~~gnl/Spiro4/10288_TR5475_c0_g1_i1.p1  ORF type:complete len:415 (+),score=75.69 gnl/Spiro4/10288_TR5475_c0_g1_i1:105-1349(+)